MLTDCKIEAGESPFLWRKKRGKSGIYVTLAYSGNIRTLIPETFGQHSDFIRTPFRCIRTPYRFKKILGILLSNMMEGRPNDEESGNVQSQRNVTIKV